MGDWSREYVYDTLGRPVSAAQFRQETVNGEQKWIEKLRLHNKYNDENQLIQQTRLLPEKTITTTFGYDSNGRLTTYNSGAGYNSTLTYDALSRLSTVTDRTNKRTYSYADGADAGTTTTRVSQVTYTGTSAGTGFEALTYSYTYDSRGNILTITDPISGNRSYTYDALGQMTKEVINGTTYTYEYDQVGNLTSYCGNTLAYSDSQWQDRLSSYRGFAQYYDGMGNPTSYHNGTGRWNFTWDGRELTKAVLKGATTPSSYSYDENGLRTTKTVVSSAGTTTHTYLYAADGTLIREIRNNPDGTTDTMEFLYDHAGQPYSFVLNNVIYYYVVNLQGDVVRIVNAAGKTVVSYVYNAWGKLLSADTTSVANAANVANKNPLRYRGYYYDTDTQLYYLQSRYYDPNLGRFLNPDVYTSTGQGIVGNNMYAYCNSCPVNASDPTGQAFFLITGAIGAIAGAIIGGLTAAANGQDVLTGIGVGAAVGGTAGLGLGAAAGVMLAGSALASTTAVATGASALGATVVGSGCTAGMMMVADNVSQAINHSPQVFWSGGEAAKNASVQLANSVNGITLEMTRLGQHLDQINASIDAWVSASRNFANVANNAASSIYSVQNAAGVKIQSIWATIEYPLMKMKDIFYTMVQ